MRSGSQVKEKTPMANERAQLFALTSAMIVAAVLGGCSRADERVDDSRTDSMAEAVPADEPVATEVSFQRIDEPAIGVRFEVPASWVRLEPEWAWREWNPLHPECVWAPNDTVKSRIGMHWVELPPPTEPEMALLPADQRRGDVIDYGPVELDWGAANSMTFEVYGPPSEDESSEAPVESIQTHVYGIVPQDDGERVFVYFYAKAASLQDLGDIEAPFQHMVISAVLIEASPNEPAPAIQD
jgi:hypothetical protein